MLSASQKKYLANASQAYADQLTNLGRDLPAGVRSYFRDHAITWDIAQKYRLGYVHAPLNGDERFAGMISIPYLTLKGVAALKFRNLTGQGGKYDQHPGQKGRLYNTPAYFAARHAIGIAEGEVDAIAATEHLGLPTLGIPGVQGWKDEWTPIFKDFTRVYVFGDGDGAGQDFAKEMVEIIGWRARMVPVPQGEDISSLAAKSQLDLLTTRIHSEEDEAA